MTKRPLPPGAIELGEAQDPDAIVRLHDLSLDCWCGPVEIVHRGEIFVCHRRADGRLATALDIDEFFGRAEGGG